MKATRTLRLGIAGVAACLLLAGAVAGSATAADQKKEELSESYRGSQRNNEAYQKIAPFKVFDNLYYVGPGFVSAWLIPMSAGIIMIHSRRGAYVGPAIGSIKKTRFAIKNTKYPNLR